MKGIQVKEYVMGPLELRPTTLADPVPAANEYTVAIRAAATNFFDLLQIRGKYQHQPPLPWVAGMEFAGVITALPAGSTPRFRVGDRVFGAMQGAYATCICCADEHLYPVPAGWSFADAAGLFVTAPTSYAAIVHRATVRPGDVVLVHAGAGGVGLAALQIAKACGARVIATAGTPQKRQICAEYGADDVIDYTTKDWPARVLALTAKKGVDVVYDPVGMVNDSLKCTAWNGRVLVIGFAAGSIENVATNRVLLKNVSLVGLHWGLYAKQEPHTVVAIWEGIFKLISEGKFRSTVYKPPGGAYRGLSDVGRALKALGERETWGKVVVELPEDEEARAKL